jgi:hypothetical protein
MNPKKVCRKRASTVVDSGGEIASNAVRSNYAKLERVSIEMAITT